MRTTHEHVGATVRTRTELRHLMAAVALAASLACGAAVAQGAGNRSTEVSQGFASGRILVMPKAGVPAAALDKAVKENGGTRSRRLGGSQLHIVDLPPGLEKQAAERLSRHPHIKFAEVDALVAPAGATNDPYYGSAWHIDHIGSNVAWDSTTGVGIKIAILDTGVDATHPDLKDRVIAGYNFYDNNTNSSDVHGHGTGVAGAAAATLNNGVGVAGVAGRASIMPIRISAPDGYAMWSTVAQGLTWAADKGAKVANISFVGVAASSSVRSAAEYMRSKGGLVVVAAGNNNKDEGISVTTSMIPVSATDTADQKASFSSWGNFVAMSAPGVGIWTTVRGGSYQTWKGTSLASPVTAAVVALMMARNPSMPATQVEKLLFDTAVDLGAAGRDPVFGHGRVDAAAAVAAVDTTPTGDTTAPTAAILSPGASSSVSGVVPVSVAVNDNVGVTSVDLVVNGRTAATDSVAPFAFGWDSTSVANGMAQLSLVARDAAGNSGASTSVAVNVANDTTAVVDSTPPSVSLANPADGSTISGNSVTVTGYASDNGGSANIRLTLAINGRTVATVTGGTLSYKWNTRRLPAGDYTIALTASDAAGNRSTKSVTVIRPSATASSGRGKKG